MAILQHLLVGSVSTYLDTDVCFSPHIPLFWGLGEMTAGTSNDHVLLKSLECTTDVMNVCMLMALP